MTAPAKARLATAAQIPNPRSAAAELAGMTRILTCGSVDDGKSTLIGRLLWEIADLPDDQRAHVLESSRGRDHLDFSVLVDGLVDERAQGITIDIAWRYFDARNRRYVVIDCPGHERYTRNMASGASHADVALLLVDARHGVRVQTRRHAAILDLVGVRHVLVSVNKMDLVDWSEATFRTIEAEILGVLGRFPFASVRIVPISARSGDNVVRPGEAAPWYHGPTLIGAIAAVEETIDASAATASALRFPVQMVVRDGRDFRGLAGTVRSGSLEVGDTLVDSVSGATARVAGISQMGRDIDVARTGEAIVVRLDRDLDIARGAILAKPEDLPTVVRTAALRLVWLSEEAPAAGGRYLLRTATDAVPVQNMAIRSRLDFEQMAEAAAATCAMNDVIRAEVSLARATALDAFASLPATGSVLLIDRLTGEVAAGGIVISGQSMTETRHVFRLTEALLRDGLCRDLGTDTPGSEELRRRGREVERLFAAAGIAIANEID